MRFYAHLCAGMRRDALYSNVRRKTSNRASLPTRDHEAGPTQHPTQPAATGATQKNLRAEKWPIVCERLSTIFFP